MEVLQVTLELGAEGAGLNAVDLALEAGLGIEDSHTAPLGTQMGVVVHTEENIQYAVFLGDCSEEAAHYAKNSSDRVMGSTYSPFL